MTPSLLIPPALARDMLREFTAGRHEYDGTAVQFERLGVALQGEYEDYINGDGVGCAINLITDQGIAYLLNASLTGGTASTNWYISLYRGNYTPVASVTAATYPAAANEAVGSTEGYTEANRPQWQPGAVTSGYLDNSASPATVTIATASTLTLYGAALHSVNGKGATTGILHSVVRYPSPRQLTAGDQYGVVYRTRLLGA